MLTDTAITTAAAATTANIATEWHGDRAIMVPVAELVSNWALDSIGSGLAAILSEAVSPVLAGCAY